MCIIKGINNWEELIGYVQLVHSTFPEDIPQIGTIGFYMMEKALSVRILDYIVGRVSGQFLSNDPLAYRMKAKNKENVRLVRLPF